MRSNKQVIQIGVLLTAGTPIFAMEMHRAPELPGVRQFQESLASESSPGPTSAVAVNIEKEPLRENFDLPQLIGSYQAVKCQENGKAVEPRFSGLRLDIENNGTVKVLYSDRKNWIVFVEKINAPIQTFPPDEDRLSKRIKTVEAYTFKDGVFRKEREDSYLRGRTKSDTWRHYTLKLTLNDRTLLIERTGDTKWPRGVPARQYQGSCEYTKQ